MRQLTSRREQARAAAGAAPVLGERRYSLSPADGFSVNGVHVDTIHGHATIHGKVATNVDRTRTERTVSEMKGVETVNNLLQVVPSDEKKLVAANDSEVKDRAEASLKTDSKMKDVKVASVNNGVVLLSGKSDSLAETLRAIENAYSVNGVHRVASEIQTIEN